jgi:hypothetical protein
MVAKLYGLSEEEMKIIHGENHGLGGLTDDADSWIKDGMVR